MKTTLDITEEKFITVQRWYGLRTKREALIFALDVLPLVTITDEVWGLAASRARLFCSKGLTLSNFAVLIFATAEHHIANILTLDRHFAQMREVLKAWRRQAG